MMKNILVLILVCSYIYDALYSKEKMKHLVRIEAHGDALIVDGSCSRSQ